MTNNFLVATTHSLAERYNDASVLENHHVASLYGEGGEGEAHQTPLGVVRFGFS